MISRLTKLVCYSRTIVGAFVKDRSKYRPSCEAGTDCTDNGVSQVRTADMALFTFEKLTSSFKRCRICDDTITLFLKFNYFVWITSE